MKRLLVPLAAAAAAAVAGRCVAAQANALEAELAAARRRRRAHVRALRRAIDDAQAVSDRLSAASLARLPAALGALLPLPTPAQLRAAGGARAARVALWETLFARVFARAAAAAVAQCAVSLAARAQIAVVAAQTAAEGPHAESLRAALMARFARLRDAERALSSAAALADASLAAATAAVGGWALTRPLRYGDVVRLLLATRTELMRSFGAAGIAALALGPPAENGINSDDGGNDAATELLLFGARSAMATREFEDVFAGCLALRFAALNRRARSLFPAASAAPRDEDVDAESGADDAGVLPPKLAPQLELAFAAEMDPAVVAAALQELGATRLVDQFMFKVFSAALPQTRKPNSSFSL